MRPTRRCAGEADFSRRGLPCLCVCSGWIPAYCHADTNVSPLYQPMAGFEEQRRRIRRRPDQAEAEIAAAAEGLLRRIPLHALTVTAIMRETTLSRNAFYVYFADRYELLARVMKPILDRLDEANALFLEGSGDLLETGRA